MEKLIAGFIRVQRGLSDLEDVVKAVTRLRSDGESADVSTATRLGVFDFPDAETQGRNIASVTSSDKAELLRRAMESPGELTEGELDLLSERYWLDVTSAERWKQASIGETFSQERWTDVMGQLKHARSLLGDEREEAVIDNAPIERGRRNMNARKQRQEAEVATSLSKTQPWFRRLWEEDLLRGKKAWGFAAFIDPAINDQEDYLSRQDAMLFHAQSNLCLAGAIGMKWNIEYLDWPRILDRGIAKGAKHDAKRHSPGSEVGRTAATEDESVRDEFAITIDALREQFRLLRDRPGKRQQTQDQAAARLSAFDDGLLTNVFLFITEESAKTVIHRPSGIDGVWVWAVEPDYEGDPAGVADDTQPVYPGYLRVRLLQLVNRFYEACRFGDTSLEALWVAAQKSRNKLFVSTREEEWMQYSGSRITGSVLGILNSELQSSVVSVLMQASIVDESTPALASELPRRLLSQ